MDGVKNRSVLVTGSRGFVGRSLCKLLQRKGYRVIGVDRTAMGIGYAGSEQVECDIRDLGQVRQICERERPEVVVHLAAVLPTAAEENPVLATQVNIAGSLNMLQSATESGARRFVFGSSLSTYGSCSHEVLVGEAHRAAPEDLYGAAKLYVERMGESYRSRGELEFVGLRIGRIVGPGAQSATSGWRSEIFEKLHATVPTEIPLPFMGTERILLVHVEDLAQMLHALVACERAEYAIYNAPCESIIVSDLKDQLESLNPNLLVRLGQQEAVGNPRRLDASRFEKEFAFSAVPINEQLKRAAAQPIA